MLMLVVDQRHGVLKNLALRSIGKDAVRRAGHTRLRSNDVNLTCAGLLDELSLVELDELLSALLIRNAGQELTGRDILIEGVGIDW